MVTDNPRITSVCLKNANGADAIISSIYMPWCDRSMDQIADYEDTIGCMQSIIDRHIGCSFIFGGDLNVFKLSPGLCGRHVVNFCVANDILWLSSGNDPLDYTYHDDVNQHYSLLDYFLCSSTVLSEVNIHACIFTDGDNPSDHLAITCYFELQICSEKGHGDANPKKKMCWEKVI